MAILVLVLAAFVATTMSSAAASPTGATTAACGSQGGVNVSLTGSGFTPGAAYDLVTESDYRSATGQASSAGALQLAGVAGYVNGQATPAGATQIGITGASTDRGTYMFPVTIPSCPPVQGIPCTGPTTGAMTLTSSAVTEQFTSDACDFVEETLACRGLRKM